MKLLSALFLVVFFSNLSLAETPQASCKAAANRIKRWVTEGGWRTVSYADVAQRTDPNVDRIIQLSGPELSPTWDYAWVPDLQERRRRRDIHRNIRGWALEAKQPRANVPELVRQISAYIADNEMYDQATVALGYVGHSSAVDILVQEVDGTIAKRRHGFWAPQALGHLDFTNDRPAYVKAEDALMRLHTAEPGATLLYNGLVGLKNDAFRTILLGNLTNRGDMWQTARAISTWNDPAFIAPMYQAIQRGSNNERSFMSLLRVMAQMRNQINAQGLSRYEVFARVVDGFFANGYEQNGDVAIALVQLKPNDCTWD